MLLSRSPHILKHPNKSFFFNPIKYLDIFYTHTVYSINIFHLNVKFVFGQGETGDEFYVIESGEVKFSTIKTEGAAPEDIGTCFQNEFFGEGSLLTENPRRATAIANGETVCYSLSGRSFRLIFGK